MLFRLLRSRSFLKILTDQNHIRNQRESRDRFWRQSGTIKLLRFRQRRTSSNPRIQRLLSGDCVCACRWKEPLEAALQMQIILTSAIQILPKTNEAQEDNNRRRHEHSINLAGHTHDKKHQLRTSLHKGLTIEPARFHNGQQFNRRIPLQEPFKQVIHLVAHKVFRPVVPDRKETGLFPTH